MSKPVNCGCGGNVDVHFIGNTYIGDYHKFTGKYFICCEKCGVKTPICKTREEAIEIWNKAMGERTANVKNITHVRGYPPEGECSNCGFDVDDDGEYCPGCGARLEWDYE